VTGGVDLGGTPEEFVRRPAGAPTARYRGAFCAPDRQRGPEPRGVVTESVHLEWKSEPVRTLLNVLWLVLSGLWLALGYAVAGIVMCLLIITIPFGVASFRLASYVLWPFGRTLVRRPDAGAPSTIANVLWFLLIGMWMAIAHLVLGFLLCVTIVGIPLGLGNFKLAAVAIAPLGKEIVRTSDPRAALGTVTF
jgi:uncharacterized membrane protein YccF (DUF307 family)